VIFFGRARSPARRIPVVIILDARRVEGWRIVLWRGRIDSLLLPLSRRGGERLAVCPIQRRPRRHASRNSRDRNKCCRGIGRDRLEDTVDSKFVAIGAFAIGRVCVPAAANLKAATSAPTRKTTSRGGSHLYLSLPAVATGDGCSLPRCGLLRWDRSHLRGVRATSGIVTVLKGSRVSVLIVLRGVWSATSWPGRRALVVLLLMVLPPLVKLPSLVIWLAVIVSWAIAGRLDWRQLISAIGGRRIPVRVRRRLGGPASLIEGLSRVRGIPWVRVPLLRRIPRRWV
jgi:hypothetical protein